MDFISEEEALYFWLQKHPMYSIKWPQIQNWVCGFSFNSPVFADLPHDLILPLKHLLTLRPQIYFRLNNVRLSKALINSVEADGTNTFERYKMSQKVTYNYYIGVPGGCVRLIVRSG